MNYTFNNTIGFLQRQCSNEDAFTVECVHKFFCPQLQTYFVKVGFWLIIIYFIINFVTKWFLAYGYQMFEFTEKLTLVERLKWEVWINEHLIIAFLMYVAVVVYLNV